MSEGAADAVGRVATRAEKCKQLRVQYLDFVSRLYILGKWRANLPIAGGPIQQTLGVRDDRSESGPTKTKRVAKKTKVKRRSAQRPAQCKKGSDTVPAEAT